LKNADVFFALIFTFMEYQVHLSKDKSLAKAMQLVDPVVLEKRENVFLWLVRSVAGQQLSTKAAASIFNKFMLLLGKKKPTPKNIASLDIEELRAVGFSYSKAGYIHNIAAFWIAEKITDDKFDNMTDGDIIKFLTQIKGVGNWTVEMLLMFTLARPDVFAVDDLGIQQGMQRLYKWPEMPLKELKLKMLAKAKSYQPYSTYACSIIWRWKDGS
jgi:DNA-3-methyladenine glycosylase II